MQGWVSEGDSITAGLHLTAAQAYPAVAAATYTAGTYQANVATTGFTCQGIRDRYATAVAPLYLPWTRKVASVMCGANNTGGDLVTYNAILTWVAAAQATGYSVVVFTMISETGQDTFKNALNARITGGAVANGYTVADSGSDPNIGCDGCYANATYFQADGIHPTAAGAAIIATYAETALGALGFN